MKRYSAEDVEVFHRFVENTSFDGCTGRQHRD